MSKFLVTFVLLVLPVMGRGHNKGYHGGTTNTTNSSSALSPIPVVMWHGLNDWCCDPTFLGMFKKLIEDNIRGLYVNSLQIGTTKKRQISISIFGNANEQVDKACKIVRRDSKLQNGYNLIGFSEGGLFARAMVQRCPHPPIKNLITLGSPHQGIYGFNNCGQSLSVSECRLLALIFPSTAYLIQSLATPAQFWHDPTNEQVYRHLSWFLADINNERSMNVEYFKNLVRLERFVMVKFEDEDIVVPKESTHFGFFAPGQARTVLPMERSRLYLEDRIGLRTLNEAGKVHRITVPGEHLQIDTKFFKEVIIEKFLK